MVQLKDILKEKRRGKCHQVGLVPARQYPGSPCTCKPEETGLPRLDRLDHHHILRIWPRRTTTCFLD